MVISTWNGGDQRIRDFISQGWKEESLKGKFFKAPQKLSQTKIYIPPIRADAAPAAFQCEKDVAPSRWMVIYKGTVTPPRSGTYRFVGAGDDVLVVRFNRQNVLDHGWVSGTSGMSISRNLGVLSGRSKDREIEKSFRGYPMNFPVTYYQYEGTEEWNRAIGGLAVGRKFEAKAGQSYPIEILICEIPGGSFGACLLMEREGEKYEKSPSGAPILPLFSLDHAGASGAEANGPPSPTSLPDGRWCRGNSGWIRRIGSFPRDGTLGDIEVYCLFVEPASAPTLPETCCTVSVSPLLRELLLGCSNSPRCIP